MTSMLPNLISLNNSHFITQPLTAESAYPLCPGLLKPSRTGSRPHYHTSLGDTYCTKIKMPLMLSNTVSFSKILSFEKFYKQGIEM